jgi:hypothetical protein
MEASTNITFHIMTVNLGSCDKFFCEGRLVANRGWLGIGAYNICAVIPNGVEAGEGICVLRFC